MKNNVVYLIILLFLVLVSAGIILWISPDASVREASGVINRVLPEYAGQFILRITEKEGGMDVFELEPRGDKIVIRGSSGVAICSGFNYYLKNYCHAVFHWRTGSNMNIKGNLPTGFEKVRKVTPYRYRYIFNYCTFSYSMAFWDWEQWERMIDWMAMNGINMPLAPMGQEIIWQRVYKKWGITEDDLKDFFVGPAYNAFGRMGCIDGFAGPLPQSWIENECLLQKKILRRERKLGMKPVLQGFTGHIPFALVNKKPDLKSSHLKWLDFPETCLLEWQDPAFMKIAGEFYSELIREYGTDHLYAIDQFIEMTPAVKDTLYLKNMSNTIISSILQADPDGKWVLQTWPFRYDLKYWTPDLTKAYLDGVPDHCMIALELTGESWKGTGWYKHQGWYGKPWIWSILSNFGDRVSIFGGLSQTAENLQKVLSSPEKGDLTGLGLIMEGLDYNPVMYEYVTDMVWETRLPDLEIWKEKFLRSRYGLVNQNIMNAWSNIFNYYYTRERMFEKNPVTNRPQLVENDIWPSVESVTGAQLLINASDELKETDSYQFDIVNLFRQVFGQYAGHLLYEISANYRERNVGEFDESVARFFELSERIEELLATREEFLLGKWIADSRERATSPEEKDLYEWNARAIITIWGGRRLYGYAMKDWAGMYSSYFLPRWKQLFEMMRTEITGGISLDYDSFKEKIMAWEDNWVEWHDEDLASEPVGDPVMLANKMWEDYGDILLRQ